MGELRRFVDFFSVLDDYNSDMFKVGEPNLDLGVFLVKLQVFLLFLIP